MDYRILLGGGVLGLAILSGCNSLPPAYDGSFSGTITGHQVEIDIQSGNLTVGVNGATQSETEFVSGFDDVLSAVENAHAGVYFLPTVVSEEGIPVNTPWVPYYDTSAGPYQDVAQASDRYENVFAVIPLNPGDQGGPLNLGDLAPIPVQGNENDFYAFVVYTKIDTQANAPVSALDVQIAPEAKVGAFDMEIAFASVKMLSLSPGPDAKPIVYNATLQRK